MGEDSGWPAEVNYLDICHGLLTDLIVLTAVFIEYMCMFKQTVIGGIACTGFSSSAWT